MFNLFDLYGVQNLPLLNGEFRFLRDKVSDVRTMSDRFKHIDEQVVPRTDWEPDTPAVSSLCCGSGDPGSVERAHAGNALLGCPSPAILC